jgi:hypothetical protein
LHLRELFSLNQKIAVKLVDEENKLDEIVVLRQELQKEF